MTIPKIPDNEAERLNALEESRLINSPMEQAFERLTSLTQRIFDVPIVAISLIDQDKQCFKSILGTDLSGTSREVSFCGHTILQDEIMVVGDAQGDTRFNNNPLVTGEPNIRFYAGYPIHASKNLPIGALCIIDNKPRTLSDAQKLILQDLALLVDGEIKNRHSMAKYKKRNLELAASERAILIDGLTRLWNYRGGLQLIEQQIKFAEKNDATFGLINLSIDSLNTFLDEYGQEAADEILKICAHRLVQICGQEDSVAYCGNKEFLIILPSHEKVNLLAAARRIQQMTTQDEFITRVGKIKMTITVGLSFFDKRIHKDSNSLLEDAHRALEEGKINGGNQIIIR